jgi:hypothetical protein
LIVGNRCIAELVTRFQILDIIASLLTSRFDDFVGHFYYMRIKMAKSSPRRSPKRRSSPRRSAIKTNPQLWKRIVAQVKAGSKGGNPGQWSARKAQLAVAKYKAAGGKYKGPKSASNSLARWTKQQWRTKSGRPSSETGERYLPAKAIKALSPSEYATTTRAKRRSSSRGEQFSRQPRKIAKKTSKYRK